MSPIEIAVALAGDLLILAAVVGIVIRRRYRNCPTFVLYLGAVLTFDLLVIFGPAWFYTRMPGS
ncbi:MAG TPA: hypothetical protein VN461_11760 [Vicinamibacteria bacterium]|jgi:hypothetical protein|nr:hypothetical protein [Vicinamibacteria bacterium]